MACVLCLALVDGTGAAVSAQEAAPAAGAPDAATPTATPPPPPEELQPLALALDASAFAEREKATAGLRELALGHGIAMRPALVAIYREAKSPEVRYRVFGILLDLAQGLEPESKPGFLGIMMMDSSIVLPDGTTATSIMVRQVVPDSAAARGGLQLSDHIVAVDGKPVLPGNGINDTASAAFSEYIRSKPADIEVALDVYSPRKRAVQKLRITLGERPDQFEDVRYKRALAEDTVKEWVRQEEN